MEDGSYAPTYKVPSKDIVSVEHPCIVRNLDKGIEMLGGPASIKEILEPGSASALGLNFMPKDPDSRPILSLNNQTNNLLLRITLPKRIGKRKRGSNEPFIPVTVTDRHCDASHLIQSLHDNPTSSCVEPLGRMESSHIWRSMPDFAYSTQSSDFLAKVKSDLLPRDLASLKRFDMHGSHRSQSTEVIPPPVLSTIPFPQQYSYRQSAHGKEMIGSLKIPDGTNTAYMTSLHTLEGPVPTSPDSNIPSLATQPKVIRNLEAVLTKLFDQRPLWTRRALLNNLPDDTSAERLRQSLGYVAFGIRAGPWRDCLCRLGVDPRDSREYRKYQTILIHRPDKSEGNKIRRSSQYAHGIEKRSHIFTGRDLQPEDGSLWQLCDIEDPQLKALVDTDESQLPTTCESSAFGWYHNGTIAKIRAVMRAKLDALRTDERLNDDVFERFLSLLPDRLEYFDADEIEAGNTNHGYLPTPTTELETDLSKEYRHFIRYSMKKVFLEAQERGEPREDSGLQGLREEYGRNANFGELPFDGPSPISQDGPAESWPYEDGAGILDSTAPQQAQTNPIINSSTPTAFAATPSSPREVMQAPVLSSQHLTAFEAAWNALDEA